MQSDIETESFNAIRDTVFGGNEDYYQYFNSALNIASLVIFPATMGAKAAASKGTGMVAGATKNLAIAGASTLAGYSVEQYTKQHGASNTTTMALGLITSMLTEKGLETGTTAVTQMNKRIKAYANSAETLRLKVRIKTTLSDTKTTIKISLNDKKARALKLRESFLEKADTFFEDLENFKNGFYQEVYVTPEGVRIPVSGWDDTPKSRVVYSSGGVRVVKRQ